MTRSSVLCLCAVTLFSAACSHQSASVPAPVQNFNQSFDKIYGKTWKIEPPGATVITLRYQDGHFIGSSGCNLWSGNVAPRDNSGGVSIMPALSTRRACVPAVMDSEHEFLNRLQAVTTMHATDHELRFTYQRGPDFGTIEFVPDYSLYMNYP
jgi:heat shock protein HslJ